MIKRTVAITVLLFALIGCNSNDTGTTEESKEENTNEVQKQEHQNDSLTDTKEDSIALPNEPLQKLSDGEAVTHLQKALIALGYPIDATGTYDEKTVWAITNIQLDVDELYVNGVYNDEVQAVIEVLLENETTVQEPYELSEPEHPDIYTETIENPYEILAVANKSFSLPKDYYPKDLTVPDVRFPFEEDHPKKQMRKEAAEALESLFSAADDAGIQLFAQSGFRSFKRQEEIFTAFAKQDGIEVANKYSAKPGESEHQTGLVMDVTSKSANFKLSTAFGDTDEGIWVAENAHEHGFIVRYPKGKESITKYDYEPWHLRYVGIKAATDMKNNDKTLEEYLSISE